MTLDELKVCLDDQWWRLSHLYWITDKEGELVRFKPNWAQEEFYKGLHYRNEILKVRQLGLSTFTAMLILDTCLWGDNQQCGINDKVIDDAKEKLSKIKLAYDHLDYLPNEASDEDKVLALLGAEIKKAKPMTKKDVTRLEWGNGSSVRVGVSIRGGTLQIIHVSEYSHVALFAPKKAREIKAGTLNAAGKNAIVIIESTHMGGKYGEAYQFIKGAMENVGKHHSNLDYKFFFFPWWRQAEYSIDEEIKKAYPDELRTYFERLTSKGVVLKNGQKNWYYAKWKEQGPAMMQEYPSTPDEALSTAVEGAIYGRQISELRAKGMMTAEFEVDKEYPTYASFDIGIADYTSIWFWQFIGGRPFIVDYKAYNDEDASMAIRLLQEFERTYDVMLDEVYLPHDAVQREKVTKLNFEGAVRNGGFRVKVVRRTRDIWDAISNVRKILPSCCFHLRCNEAVMIGGREYLSGVASLENYKRRPAGVSGEEREAPLHDACSHGADAFRTGAEAIALGYMGGVRSVEHQPKRRRVTSDPTRGMLF